MTIDPSELSEAEFERVVNTSIFRRALAYKRLADGIEALKEDDEMFDQLCRDVNAEAGSRVKVDTTRRQLEAFVSVVERYTQLVDDDGDVDVPVDANDVADVLVDDGGGE